MMMEKLSGVKDKSVLKKPRREFIKHSPKDNGGIEQ
jgi:hypothetical protein